MYLSRIRLNTDKRATQIAMVSPNKIHGAIEDSFSKKQERNLWRIDCLKGDTFLLILSQEIPNFTGIIEQFGFDEENGESKEYDPFIERIQEGTIWHFRLVANPTYTKKQAHGRGKVVAHVSEKYQMKWLYEKGEKNGFEIVDDCAELRNSKWIVFKKKDQRSRVRIKQATFEGTLKVTDVDKFKSALICGIGREKAYGMGLLTLVRV